MNDDPGMVKQSIWWITTYDVKSQERETRMYRFQGPLPLKHDLDPIQTQTKRITSMRCHRLIYSEDSYVDIPYDWSMA